MKTLYVSDLDGTLLNKEARLSDRSLHLLKQLLDKGIPFTYATARSLSSALVVTEGLPVRLPAVVYNGAMLREPSSGKILSIEHFTREERDSIIQCLESKSLSTMVYAFVEGEERVSYRTDRINEALAFYLDNRRGDRRLRPVSSARELYEGELFYVTNVGNTQELSPIFDSFRDGSIANCVFYQEIYRTDYWCELMPRTATKAHGLQKLKELLGFDRAVCFGDAINDLPLFRVADECYAVENAAPELKEAATGIIGANDTDAVAQWLFDHAVIA